MRYEIWEMGYGTHEWDSSSKAFWRDLLDVGGWRIPMACIKDS